MVEINEALLKTLATAQLKYVHSMTDDETIAHSFWSDDGYDYLKGALALGQDLLSMQFNDDLDALRVLLDPSNHGFVAHNYASDGICGAVYDALPVGWEVIAYEES